MYLQARDNEKTYQLYLQLKGWIVFQNHKNQNFQDFKKDVDNYIEEYELLIDINSLENFINISIRNLVHLSLSKEPNNICYIETHY